MSLSLYINLQDQICFQLLLAVSSNSRIYRFSNLHKSRLEEQIAKQKTKVENLWLTLGHRIRELSNLKRHDYDCRTLLGTLFRGKGSTTTGSSNYFALTAIKLIYFPALNFRSNSSKSSAASNFAAETDFGNQNIPSQRVRGYKLPLKNKLTCIYLARLVVTMLFKLSRTPDLGPFFDHFLRQNNFQ